MNTETIVYCFVALLLGMLLANTLKNVCGCKTVEGSWNWCPGGTYKTGFDGPWTNKSMCTRYNWKDLFK